MVLNRCGYLWVLGRERLRLNFVRVRERMVDEDDENGTMNPSRATLHFYKIIQDPVMCHLPTWRVCQLEDYLPHVVGQFRMVVSRFMRPPPGWDSIRPATTVESIVVLHCPSDARQVTVEFFDRQVAGLQQLQDDEVRASRPVDESRVQGGAPDRNWLSIRVAHDLVFQSGVAVDFEVRMHMLEHADGSKEFLLVSEGWHCVNGTGRHSRVLAHSTYEQDFVAVRERTRLMAPALSATASTLINKYLFRDTGAPPLMPMRRSPHWMQPEPVYFIARVFGQVDTIERVSDEEDAGEAWIIHLKCPDNCDDAVADVYRAQALVLNRLVEIDDQRVPGPVVRAFGKGSVINVYTGGASSSIQSSVGPTWGGLGLDPGSGLTCLERHQSELDRSGMRSKVTGVLCLEVPVIDAVISLPQPPRAVTAVMRLRQDNRGAIALDLLGTQYTATRDRTIEDRDGALSRYSYKAIVADGAGLSLGAARLRPSVYCPSIVGQVHKMDTVYEDNPLDHEGYGRLCWRFLIGCPEGANQDTCIFFEGQIEKLQELVERDCESSGAIFGGNFLVHRRDVKSAKIEVIAVDWYRYDVDDEFMDNADRRANSRREAPQGPGVLDDPVWAFSVARLSPAFPGSSSCAGHGSMCPFCTMSSEEGRYPMDVYHMQNLTFGQLVAGLGPTLVHDTLGVNYVLTRDRTILELGGEDWERYTSKSSVYWEGVEGDRYLVNIVGHVRYVRANPLFNKDEHPARQRSQWVIEVISDGRFPELRADAIDSGGVDVMLQAFICIDMITKRRACYKVTPLVFVFVFTLRSSIGMRDTSVGAPSVADDIVGIDYVATHDRTIYRSTRPWSRYSYKAREVGVHFDSDWDWMLPSQQPLSPERIHAYNGELVGQIASCNFYFEDAPWIHVDLARTCMIYELKCPDGASADMVNMYDRQVSRLHHLLKDDLEKTSGTVVRDWFNTSGTIASHPAPHRIQVVAPGAGVPWECGLVEGANVRIAVTITKDVHDADGVNLKMFTLKPVLSYDFGIIPVALDIVTELHPIAHARDMRFEFLLMYAELPRISDCPCAWPPLISAKLGDDFAPTRERTGLLGEDVYTFKAINAGRVQKMGSTQTLWQYTPTLIGEVVSIGEKRSAFDDTYQVLVRCPSYASNRVVELYRLQVASLMSTISSDTLRMGLDVESGWLTDAVDDAVAFMKLRFSAGFLTPDLQVGCCVAANVWLYRRRTVAETLVLLSDSLANRATETFVQVYSLGVQDYVITRASELGMLLEEDNLP
ncbi:hypothetical protein DFH07DRAFT_765754 [Mycena maculata]|uniref:Uncharacterized protein n=1 Tax=Mycena maculata TaxID=230809 RepID=A0AAD7NXW6_9AGAR|nr:hypothetical protein DFH07DRAFT_765754 [Mycena maculata]